MPAAHDIYAEQLRDLRRGHPLYHPEPRPEGPVKIGDVGYTKDGAFRRLFNISQPANDPVQRFGVPEDFVPLDLGAIDEFDAVLEPGPLHSRTISTLSTEVGTPGEILPAEASFRFSCSSKRGAILMLETQMMREEAVQSRHLEAYAMKHCRSWHSFVRDLGIHIGFGDLMLITECSKTAAWSSAVYSNSSTEFGLSFSVGVPFSMAGISASSSLEKIGPVERRRSQKRAHTQDSPLPKNHTVFIKAYRVGMRQMYYRSLISIFMKERSSSLRQGETEDMGGTRSRLISTAPNNSPPPTSPSESSVAGLYDPDFHAPVALLALEMEKKNDREFVVLHDDVWCTMNPDSEMSQIMDEYTNFHFSDELTTSLYPTLDDDTLHATSSDLDWPSHNTNEFRIYRSTIKQIIRPTDETYYHIFPGTQLSVSRTENVSPPTREVETDRETAEGDGSVYSWARRCPSYKAISIAVSGCAAPGKSPFIHLVDRSFSSSPSVRRWSLEASIPPPPSELGPHPRYETLILYFNGKGDDPSTSAGATGGIEQSERRTGTTENPATLWLENKLDLLARGRLLLNNEIAREEKSGLEQPEFDIGSLMNDLEYLGSPKAREDLLRMAYVLVQPLASILDEASMANLCLLVPEVWTIMTIEEREDVFQMMFPIAQIKAEWRSTQKDVWRGERRNNDLARGPLLRHGINESHLH